ncbi:MAG: RNA polymerase sigma factor [Chthoniobacterales bacterium]
MSPIEIIENAFSRYEKPLISYAREITGDLESARDAVQETFLRLSKQDVASLQERLAPWLFCVCRNCALDHQRKIVRFREESIEEDEQITDQTPADQASNKDESQQLQKLICRLPEKQRELLKLKFEAGLSYKEMAETMNMSVSHIGVTLHEAIQTLRKHTAHRSLNTAH